jgi:hypothetical protein
MKKPFMVEFELPEDFDDEFIALIPSQRLHIDELLALGKIRSYALSRDRSVLWVVVEAHSEFEVMEMIANMPLASYMQPFVSELMFYHTSEKLMQFSLN